MLISNKNFPYYTTGASPVQMAKLQRAYLEECEGTDGGAIQFMCKFDATLFDAAPKGPIAKALTHLYLEMESCRFLYQQFKQCLRPEFQEMSEEEFVKAMGLLAIKKLGSENNSPEMFYNDCVTSQPIFGADISQQNLEIGAELLRRQDDLYAQVGVINSLPDDQGVVLPTKNMTRDEVKQIMANLVHKVGDAELIDIVMKGYTKPLLQMLLTKNAFFVGNNMHTRMKHELRKVLNALGISFDGLDKVRIIDGGTNNNSDGKPVYYNDKYPVGNTAHDIGQALGTIVFLGASPDKDAFPKDNTYARTLSDASGKPVIYIQILGDIDDQHIVKKMVDDLASRGQNLSLLANETRLVSVFSQDKSKHIPVFVDAAYQLQEGDTPLATIHIYKPQQDEDSQQSFYDYNCYG